LQKHSSDDHELLDCFRLATEKNNHLVRAGSGTINSLRQILNSLEVEVKSKKFGSGILCNSLFIQFMVQLNRLYLKPEKNVEFIDVEYDEQIESIIRYINSNLSASLTVDTLANKFYMNKYYLMHKFKSKTGYTLHNYIGSKRLLKSSELIKSGMGSTDAATECGFNDYSSFVRAFTKMFGSSPTNYYKLLKCGSDCFIIEG
jgi:AraC-like DNA-binding protein